MQYVEVCFMRHQTDLELIEVEGRVHHLAVAFPVFTVGENETLAKECLHVCVQVVLGEQTTCPLRENLLHQLDLGDADGRHSAEPVQKYLP